jgi:hypothetical protein
MRNGRRNPSASRNAFEPHLAGLAEEFVRVDEMLVQVRPRSGPAQQARERIKPEGWL